MLQTVVFLTLLSIVFANPLTTFKQVPLGTKSSTPKNGETSYAVGSSSRSLVNPFVVVPSDDGSENWGDNLWKKRIEGDSLVIREIQINAIDEKDQQEYNWNVNVPDKIITHMRFINIGRQRGYVYSVTGSDAGPKASAVILIPPKIQFRLLIEVYVK